MLDAGLGVPGPGHCGAYKTCDPTTRRQGFRRRLRKLEYMGLGRVPERERDPARREQQARLVRLERGQQHQFHNERHGRQPYPRVCAVSRGALVTRFPSARGVRLMGVAEWQTPTPAALPSLFCLPALSPQDCSLEGYPSSPESSVSLDPHDPLQVHEPEAARASQGREIGSVRGLGAKLRVDKNPVNRKASGEARQPSAGGVPKGVAIDFSISPNDLALATVPGQDFDPRTRSFTEDELKPQPMIKKSRKQFVPSELKDDKYWARRRKNNLAAKRSRDARRLKENQIAMRANFLEKENVALRLELEKTVKEVETLKSRLEKYEGI
nr:transcription factor VBP-like [Penaeus vannamei]